MGTTDSVEMCFGQGVDRSSSFPLNLPHHPLVVPLSMTGLLSGPTGPDESPPDYPNNLRALAPARLIQCFLFGVEAADPATLVAVPLVLGTVAVLAAFIPARRASRVDPVKALKTE